MGTAVAADPGVQHEANIPLAIRTVVVTTRSAARTHHDAGHDRLARDAVARGLQLLDALSSRLHADPTDDVGRLYEAARQELDSLHAELTPGSGIPR